MAEIEKLEDSKLDSASGGYGSQRWAVRCGNCGLTHQICSDQLTADGVSNSLIINHRGCPRCNRIQWYVSLA